jgi:hypothetical protein
MGNLNPGINYTGGSSGGSGLGAWLAYASPAGTSNNVAPTGFGSSIGRLWVTLGSGNATWTGLTAGADAQLLILTNADTANDLTIDVANAASTATNRFYGSPGSYSLSPGNSLWLCYYGGSVNRWMIVP